MSTVNKALAKAAIGHPHRDHRSRKNRRIKSDKEEARIKLYKTKLIKLKQQYEL